MMPNITQPNMPLDIGQLKFAIVSSLQKGNRTLLKKGKV